MSRTLQKNADRIGVFIIVPAILQQSLDPAPIHIESAKDLILALSDLSDVGVHVLRIESTTLMDMVTNVARTLGIAMYKLIDAVYVDEDFISHPVRNRVSIFDGVTLQQLEGVRSLFTSYVKMDKSGDDPLDAAFGILDDSEYKRNSRDNDADPEGDDANGDD